MCWMTIRREHDALANGIVETRRHEESNGHSWGAAWLHDGEIRVVKDVGTIPDSDPPVTDAALVHTRYATKGEVNRQNAHPFELEAPDGEIVGALAHNGTWYGAPSDDDRSDSWYMARYFEHSLRNGSFEEAVRDLARETGETFVILRNTGEIYVYSGRFTITREGSVVASNGYNRIRDEEILRIGTDSSIESVVSPVRQRALRSFQ